MGRATCLAAWRSRRAARATRLAAERRRLGRCECHWLGQCGCHWLGQCHTGQRPRLARAPCPKDAVHPGHSRTVAPRRRVRRTALGPTRRADARSGLPGRRRDPLSTGRSLLPPRPVAVGRRGLHGFGRPLSGSCVCAVGDALALAILFQRRGGLATHCDAAEQARRLQRAVAVGRHIERARLDWFLEPEVRFPLAAAYGGLGDTRAAERLYQAQERRGRDAWWQCAQGELRLSPRGLGSVGVERARQAGVAVHPARRRPHLDGRLDEAVWRDAKQAALTSAQHDDGQWPASIMLAYDDEYLYLAVQCRDPPGPAAARRSRPVRPSVGRPRGEAPAAAARRRSLGL